MSRLREHRVSQDDYWHVARLFRSGCDTAEIAAMLDYTEAAVANILPDARRLYPACDCDPAFADSPVAEACI